MTLQRVIVGVDGSKGAFAAAQWAAAQAEKLGGRLSIVCAYSMASYSAAALDGGFALVDDRALKLGAEQVVSEAAKSVSDYPIDVEEIVQVGDPSVVLTELSAEADLLVISSRGGGGLADRLLGSVSSSVPAHARCAVAMVPEHVSGKPFMPIERIVVGVDGSDVASSALCTAVDVAIAWGAELTVITAVPIATGGGAMSWMPVAVDRKALIEDIHNGLDAAIEQALAGRELKVARHALDGSPAALLTEFSTAVDLVVVGTRGRGGFAGMLLGSTSNTVLHHSTCPVMTVPSRHRDRRPNPTTAWDRL
ncbi:universal stress protein [Actinomycetaceae bacterium WB03_NA08]|uniref:Universal stress protein n=1 Tax=Scrofimicrobium canadense TaxID=2652290 RepID=A0A6N7VVY3_9ACTO|nr:universal stress protein [Scrofimicrobium canadense]MSS85150.1 universal stress protein [Scrofimicrobium canadense]